MNPRRRLVALILIAACWAVPVGTVGQAQAPRTLTPADSQRWESLVPTPAHLGLSPDGTTIAYRIDRSNWDDELRITRIADNRTIVIPFGREPEYSADGRWLIYSIGHSQQDEARLNRNRQPVRDALGLVQLSTLAETRFADVESASFSADGAYLAMERYPSAPATAARGAGGRRGNGAESTRLFIRSLSGQTAGTEVSFDNVRSFEWQPEGGHAMAMLMGGDSQAGARVQLVDPSVAGPAAVTVLDASASTFRQLSWRPTGIDLAFLRGRDNPRQTGLAFDVVVVRNAASATRTTVVYDATRDATFDSRLRIVDTRALEWSRDGAVLFVGVSDENARASRVGNDTDVRVWHWRDVVVMPRQAEQNTPTNTRVAAISLDAAHAVVLSPTAQARVRPMDGSAFAWVADWSAYAMARTLGRPAADLSVVNVRTGVRTPVAAGIDESDVRVRPDGGALVFVRDDHLCAFDTATARTTDLSATSSAALIDLQADDTAPHKPLFGIAGWTTTGEVLAYDRYDIWRISPNGSVAQRLTDGAATRTRHRLALVDADRAVDLSAPLYIALFGEHTKESGYARRSVDGKIETLLWQPRHIDLLNTSADGGLFAYTVQDFDDSPDIFISGPDLANGRAVTTTNPQQTNFVWGRSAVIDYTTVRGDQLQAALYYPAGYIPGKRYPTIVKLYERLSDEVHEYVSPSDMDEANISIFTALGYAVIAPDVRYRPREPGVSTVEAVTAAVARAVSLGVTDAARVGAIGHSWGAYGSAFLATHTQNVFAAAVAGAPITDLISQYGNHHWSTGVAETDHIETGQQRMQVPFFDDVDAYVRNSPIFGVRTMTTPLLLEAGDDDGEVFWHQSVELYNAARRIGKPVVLLQYPGEDHVLDDFDHRRDYQRRILEWFGHYLKGEPAVDWIVKGSGLSF